MFSITTFCPHRESNICMVDRVFEPRLSQTKDYKTGICCFSTKHAALMRKSKDWLARNQNIVSELIDMSTCLPWTVVSVS